MQVTISLHLRLLLLLLLRTAVSRSRIHSHLLVAVFFLPPDLLRLTDSHACPQPSITHSPTHSTGYRLLRSTSSHHYLLAHSAFSRGASVAYTSYLAAATVAAHHATYDQLFSHLLSLPLYHPIPLSFTHYHNF